MIKPEQIPDKVVEAGRIAWLESASDYTRLDESIRAALAAALSAWRGVRIVPSETVQTYGRTEPYVILPLPNEGRLPEDEWGPPVGKETL